MEMSYQAMEGYIIDAMRRADFNDGDIEAVLDELRSIKTDDQRAEEIAAEFWGE